MNVSCQQHRLRLSLQGVVQGVGFRPFVYRLATELGLGGWVKNSTQGVVIDVEGARSHLDAFLQRLELEQPPQAHIQNFSTAWLDPVGYAHFEIQASETDAQTTTLVAPDLATCSDCLHDLWEPTNRRYRYPFTNCTNCGPRFSILERLPYDRPHTTMRAFQLCEDCQREYDDPRDRRFHAEPNACPHCGPRLEFWSATGELLAVEAQALAMTTAAIRQGKIMAIKSLGGFQLVVDACNPQAIQRLRVGKQRIAKPFALMYPSLALVKVHCEVSAAEEAVLRSSAAPIVLLKRRASPPSEATNQLGYPDAAVAPNTPYLGIMLPYTPLHHLLLQDLGFPIVATSGNRANEPLCTGESDAIQCLGSLADGFLVHNRAIAHPVDDSVVRVVLEQPVVLRRARGYAPLPLQGWVAPTPCPSVLAVGAHLKSAIAFSNDRQVFMSQYIGDLETVASCEALQRTIAQFQQLYDLRPVAIACDAHPDYYSTQVAHQLAAQWQIPVISVQHHYAHVLACMAEHQLQGPVLGVAWDGTGYGLDGSLWGGEFLLVRDPSYRRVAHLRSFRLPGGEIAVKEPRRAAIGLLYELFGNEILDQSMLKPIQSFSPPALKLLTTMLRQALNAPKTTSAGRLFDAIAALLGLGQLAQFEGQAAMTLESAIESCKTAESYPFAISQQDIEQPLIIDWENMMHALLADYWAGLSNDLLAAKFHNTLVEMVLAVAQKIGVERVVLTGGCFQNQYLLERAVETLQAAGFQPYWPQQVPCNDGGLALGQLMAAWRVLAGGQKGCV